MEYSSITHNMDSHYCYAISNNKFMFRLHAKRNDLSTVILHYQDKYIPILKKDTHKQVEMKIAAKDLYIDYFEAIINIDVICLRYYFELTDTTGHKTYYGHNCFFSNPIEDIGDMYDCPQTLREEECFIMPDWANNKIAYQIFVDRFASNESQPPDLWYNQDIHHNERLHGNLKGITQKLDYLHKLGIDILYLTPIFKANTSHKYDTIDYYEIDSEFGTKKDLTELVTKAHSMNIRIILDGVFNHTSTDFFAFKNIRECPDTTIYKDWYYIDSLPVISKPNKHPNYKSFAYIGFMPKLRCTNPEVQEYIFNVVSYWIINFDIDGWRLDVGDEISHFFWREFRKKVKSIKPDALIVGETWHYAADYLYGDEWDSVMNYHFCTGIWDFICRNRISASEFVSKLQYMKGNIHSKVFPVLWNLIDSHDTARCMYLCGEDKRKYKLAVAFQLLFTGTPMIYYGDEYGMSGGQDPGCRKGMLWDKRYQDIAIFNWYKKLIKLRKKYPVLLNGEDGEILCNDSTRLITWEKKNKNKSYFIIFNNNDIDIELHQYEKNTDIITNSPFNGIIPAFGTVIIRKNNGF